MNKSFRYNHRGLLMYLIHIFPSKAEDSTLRSYATLLKPPPAPAASKTQTK
jgi:hypothetical protein